MFAFHLFGIGPTEIFCLAVGVGFVGLCLALVLVLTLRPKKRNDPDVVLRQELRRASPPPAAGTHQLLFEGRPVRLRMAVLAPAGRNVELNSAMAEGVLQAVLHGLGEVADLDKPNIQVWPSQLSQEGFAPKFFSNVVRPEPAGEPSTWVLVAGPVKAGPKTILLGLALQAAEPSTRGNDRMDEEKWADKLRVKIVE